MIRLFRTAILAGAAALAIAPALARAETCAEGIARLQLEIDRSRASDIAPLPESNFATMHRQPTRDSVAAAKATSESRTSQLLDEARKQEAEGKEAQCLKTLNTIVMPR